MIGGVEAHQSRETAPVCLGQRVPDQVALAREALLERVQPREDLLHRFVVARLSRREAGPVYAVVEVLVDEFVDEVDLSAQRRRIVVARLRAHAVEGAVELPENQRAVRPGTVVSDVEVIAARLCPETRRAVRGDEAAELALWAHEAAGDLGRAPVGPLPFDQHAHALRLTPPSRPRS